MSSTSGTLTLRPVMAELSEDHDWLGKQDPYIVIQVGMQKMQSQVCRGGGKRPSWNDVFNVRVNAGSYMKIQLWDKDKFTEDDYIGEGTLETSCLMMKPGKATNWISLRGKKGECGRLLLESDFTSDSLKTTSTPGYADPYQQKYTQQTDPYSKQVPTQQQQTSFPQQGYPQQSYPQQQTSLPQQGLSQQGYSQQTYPQQQTSFPQQGCYTQQNYPQQQMQGGVPQQQQMPGQKMQGDFYQQPQGGYTQQQGRF